MALDQTKAETIINELRSYDVGTRLKAINEAREMFRNTFKPDMTDSQWSYSAYVVEQLYNLIREELRVSQIRIKTEKSGKSTPDEPKAAKPKKEKKQAPTMDMAMMLQKFAEFKAKGGN